MCHRSSPFPTCTCAKHAPPVRWACVRCIFGSVRWPMSNVAWVCDGQVRRCTTVYVADQPKLGCSDSRGGVAES